MSDENDLLFGIFRNGGDVIIVPLDEDGKPDGEAFCKELSEVLSSIPPVWVRLKSNPEWTAPNAFSVNAVVGSMLLGVMNASGRYTRAGVPGEDEVPEDLTGLARFLKYELTHNYPAPHFNVTVFTVSLCELGEFVWSRIGEGKWFTERTCDPEVAVHNGLIALRNELREEARFEERLSKGARV